MFSLSRGQTPLCLFEMETNILSRYVSSHNRYCTISYRHVYLWLASTLFDRFVGR
jgi:hypothetical protein